MIIEVLGQKQAVEYAEYTRVRTSVISITSKGDADVVFRENPNIVSVLHLKFNDLTEKYTYHKYDAQDEEIDSGTIGNGDSYQNPGY